MRIFAAVPDYPPQSRVGAWLCTHEYLAGCAAAGDEVRVLTLHDRHEEYSIDGVRVFPMLRGFDLTRGIEWADVVVSHAGDNGTPAEHAARIGRPSVRLAHGRLREPEQLEGAALVVFNSESLRDSAPWWSGPSVVINPPVWPERHRVELAPAGRVTLVNLTHAKGGSLFWRLARQLDTIAFLGVRGGYGVQLHEDRPNVRVIPTTDDMRADVWRSTRVLLMPSESETWGMVALEAACSGIPTIAHPTPGLLESLGESATFVDRDDAGGWVAAIERLQDLDVWTAASAAALDRAGRLDPAASVAAFVESLHNLTRGEPADESRFASTAPS